MLPLTVLLALVAVAFGNSPPADHQRSDTSYDWCDCGKGLQHVTAWPGSDKSQSVTVQVRHTCRRASEHQHADQQQRVVQLLRSHQNHQLDMRWHDRRADFLPPARRFLVMPSCPRLNTCQLTCTAHPVDGRACGQVESASHLPAQVLAALLPALGPPQVEQLEPRAVPNLNPFLKLQRRVLVARGPNCLSCIVAADTRASRSQCCSLHQGARCWHSLKHGTPTAVISPGEDTQPCCW